MTAAGRGAASTGLSTRRGGLNAVPAAGGSFYPNLPLVGLGYASALGLVASYVAARPAPVRYAWFTLFSTNLVNLTDHPIRSLVGSAFITDESPTDWVVLAFVGLTVAGAALGDLRLVGLLAAGHVLGSLLSESVVDLQIRAGQLPITDRAILDIGPSYVVAPALVLGILYGSTVGRVLAGICFVALEPHLFIGLGHLEVSAVGHVVAIVLALLVGPVLVRDRRARQAAVPLVLSRRAARMTTCLTCGWCPSASASTRARTRSSRWNR